MRRLPFARNNSFDVDDVKNKTGTQVFTENKNGLGETFSGQLEMAKTVTSMQGFKLSAKEKKIQLRSKEESSGAHESKDKYQWITNK